MKKILAVTALIGLVGAATGADAAPAAATLISVTSYSPNGSLLFNRTADTSTWTFDVATGTATQTGGTYSALAKIGSVATLFQTTMTGATLGNFAPTAMTWGCIEGSFGPQVGASICGNYNFGSNFTNESTYTPTTTGATVIIGGDDGAIGPPQSLVTSFSSMVASNAGPPSPGTKWYCLSNANTTDTCSLGSVGATATAGYTFIFEVSDVQVPATVVIGGCDSGVPNYNVVPGSTLNDAIGQCPVPTPRSNLGKFVQCVAKLTNEWRRSGLITGAQKGAIMRCAPKGG